MKDIENLQAGGILNKHHFFYEKVINDRRWEYNVYQSPRVCIVNCIFSSLFQFVIP